MRRALVNMQVLRIFKRILESWNPAKNAKKLAKTGGRKISRASVYHPRINHESALREMHGLLSWCNARSG
jgi:hypothetical protein